MERCPSGKFHLIWEAIPRLNYPVGPIDVWITRQAIFFISWVCFILFCFGLGLFGWFWVFVFFFKKPRLLLECFKVSKAVS
jgi:hypothetical protein